MIKFGWKRDLPDFRDYSYRLHPENMGAPPLPESIDLRPLMSPVEDQGNLGSCVAQSLCGVLEFLELCNLKQHLDHSAENFGKIFQDLSRLFVYWNARTLDGDNQSDNGTQIRTAIKALRRFGICREAVWPYNQFSVFSCPVPSAFAEGVQHKVLKGYRIYNESMNDMRQCLANGYPFAFGVSIFDSFMSSVTDKTAVVSLPEKHERMLGGHAMCCVGYDDKKEHFLVRNSWGVNWGDQGYCWIPYEYLNRSDLCGDCWTIRDE